MLDAAWSRGTRYLTITGGEPFLHPEIRDILQMAHGHGFWITVLTNALSIDDDMASFLSEFWRLQIRVSLEGADVGCHEYFRGKGTFAPMIAGIDRLRDSGVQVNLGLTIYEENKDQIDAVVRLCIDKGCASLRVVPVVRIEKGVQATTSKSLYQGILRDLVRAAITYEKHLTFSADTALPDLPVSSFTTQPCFAGSGFFGIEPDGTLLPCSLIRFAKNLPLRKYRNPSDLDEFRDDMRAYFAGMPRPGSGICADCEYYDRCRGGCIGEKLSFGFDPEDSQPVCVKTLIESLLREFKPGQTKRIVDSWIVDMRSSLEDRESGYCMRQAPFWKLSFFRKRH